MIYYLVTPKQVRGMMIEKKIKNSIREFWAASPMTYGSDHGKATFTKEDGSTITVAIGTSEFFEHADHVLYEWNAKWHGEEGHFSKLFDYKSFKGKPVLEVGCGLGCMAMNWAQQGALLSAVDLNPVAIEQTKHRFSLYGLKGDIREADGEKLPFKDATFDYTYSWGVLHHSPNTGKSISELYRVLKPGGRVGVMLYHRKSIWQRFFTEYIEGFLNMEKKFLNPVELASRYGDGYREEGNPHTWPVTKKEVHQDLFSQFKNVKITVLGTELVAIFNQLIPNLGSKIPKPLMDVCIRRWGWSLWITGEKAS